MKRQIITVDMEGGSDKLSELQNALAEPKAKIISSVSAANIVVYVVESPN